MLIIAYDISNDKLRTQFSKFIQKFGYRLQYSVFKIYNSPKVLNNIILNIEGRFAKRFSNQDSIIIFKLSNQCNIYNYGYAKNEDSDLIMI